MKYVKSLTPSIMLLAFFLLSCQSDGNLLKEESLNAGPIMAKVFNGENRACQGVSVTLTDEKGRDMIVPTDITGKALFPKVSYGSYQVTMMKPGYEDVSFAFDYARPDQALYGRLYSFDQLLREATVLMEEGEWDEAALWLDRAREIDGDDNLLAFHYSILLWKRGRSEEAAKILEEKRSDSEILPYEMNLFLADLYQYDLERTEDAMDLLEELMNHHNEKSLQVRIDQLNKEIKDNV